MNLKDIFKLFISSYATIKSVKNPFLDYYTVELIPEKNFSWTAGSYAKFTLPNRKVKGKKYRILSMASTEEEGIILLGFRTTDNVSSFKKELIDMKVGEIVKINGPFGGFKKHEDKNNIVMFSSGVGIVPMRGFLKSLENDSRKIDIVFVSNDEYLFLDDLKEISENIKNVEFHLFKHREETTKKLIEITNEYQNNAHYYICGSPEVLNKVRNNLTKNGISKKNITYDPFSGY